MGIERKIVKSSLIFHRQRRPFVGGTKERTKDKILQILLAKLDRQSVCKSRQSMKQSVDVTSRTGYTFASTFLLRWTIDHDMKRPCLLLSEIYYRIYLCNEMHHFNLLRGANQVSGPGTNDSRTRNYACRNQFSTSSAESEAASFSRLGPASTSL